MEKQDQNKTRFKWLTNKYIVVSILFLAYIVFFDENSIVDHIKSRQQLQQLIEQKEYYKERIVSDNQKIKDLNSGVEELEKFAREQFLMSKPDEDVFIIIEKK